VGEEEERWKERGEWWKERGVAWGCSRRGEDLGMEVMCACAGCGRGRVGVCGYLGWAKGLARARRLGACEKLRKWVGQVAVCRPRKGRRRRVPRVHERSLMRLWRRTPLLWFVAVLCF